MALHHNIDPNIADTDNEGRIYLDGERIILTSSTVFGILRKDLMENISEERMKGFLIRYGWNLGKKDAQTVLKKNLSFTEEILKQGPALHMMKGYTKVKRVHLQIGYDSDGLIDTVHVEGIWSGSYEAEEHVRQFGISATSVCHTLVGYASGYYSEICNKTVLFKEVSCKATGSDNCYYVGKTIPEWEGSIDGELKHYEDAPIVHELESTYEKLLKERNSLAKTFSIHERLTEELVNGNDIQSIADAIFQETSIPILIEDADFHPLANSGFPTDFFEVHYPDYKSNVHDQIDGNYYRTREITKGDDVFLTTPIILKKKCFGFCSFVYREGKAVTKMDQMILERAAAVCSLYILNEKTTFEATERLKGHFLDQIIDGSLLSEREILNRGRYINVELEKPYFMMALNYDNQYKGLKNELIFHEQVMEHIQKYFKSRSNVLIGQRSGIIVLLIQKETQEKSMLRLCERFTESLQKGFPTSSFRIGVSTFAENIAQANEHYSEAITALKMTSATEEIRLFEDISVAGLLIHAKNKEAIKQKAKQLLGPLYQHKDDNAELIKTLNIFLSNGGNLEKSMEKLSLSMSGLRYRIRRLEEMLEQDLREPAVGYELLLSLQVLDAEGEITLD